MVWVGIFPYSKSQLGFKTYRTILRDDIILSSDLSSGVIIGSDANLMNRFSSWW